MGKRRKTRKILEPPTCNCLLLCDDVLISQGRDKHILQGVIGVIFVAQVPAVISGYVAYVRVSNVYGSQKIKLRFERAADDEILMEGEAEFPSQASPLGVYTLVVPVPPIAVREPGRYMFSAVHDGVPFAQSPIEIRLLEPRSQP